MSAHHPKADVTPRSAVRTAYPLGPLVERTGREHILEAAVAPDEKAAADVGPFGDAIFANERRILRGGGSGNQRSGEKQMAHARIMRPARHGRQPLSTSRPTC